MNIFKSIFQHFKIIRNIKNIKDDFIAKKIQMHQLLYELKAFSEDKTEFDFIGSIPVEMTVFIFGRTKAIWISNMKL